MISDSQSGAQSDFYYNAKGEQVFLELGIGLYVVNFKPGKRSNDPTLLEKSRRFLQDNSEHLSFIAHYGLQVYESRNRDVAVYSEELRLLQQEAIVNFVTPVFQRSPHPMDRIYLLNRFIVEFQPGVSEAQAKQHLQTLNAQYQIRVIEQLRYTLPEIGYLLQTPDGFGERGPIELAKRYYEAGLLSYAIPDLVQRHSFRNEKLTVSENHELHRAPIERNSSPIIWQFQKEQWHLEKANVVNAWHHFTRGDASITIAISDDGIDVNHAEFSSKVRKQYDFANNSADGNPKSEVDNHGTACAGVAVASGLEACGVAPDCSLMAVRYPDAMGVADEARMFEWMADNGADIISCSWGPQDGTGAIYPLPDNVRRSIRYCITSGRNGKGIPIVWAAGNGKELVSSDGYASNPDVIAIAACTDKDTQAWYSDFGPEIWVCAPSSGKRDAGEKRIFTTDRQGAAGYNSGEANLGDSSGNYTNDFGGTSAAAPLVAGIVGLMLSVKPNLKWYEVREILKQTADKIGDGYDANGHSNIFGFGRVNAYKAVEAAKTGTIPTPITTIIGPDSLPRSGSPPTFMVSTGSNLFYAVEVTTRSELFDKPNHGAERTLDNFYASWQEPISFFSTPTYTLPTATWERLKRAERLYYRIWASTSNSQWQNPTTTTPDGQAQSAPFIQLKGQWKRLPDIPYRSEEDLWRIDPNP